MPLSSQLTDQVPPAFVGFFDDAAVFPPGSAPLPMAVRDHLWRRDTAYGPAVGRLLVTPGHAAALSAEAGDAAAARGIDLSVDPISAGLVVSPGGLAAANAAAARLTPGVLVDGFELKLDPTANRADIARLAAEALESIPDASVHFEVSLAQLRGGAAEVLADTPAQLKFRTGGLEPWLFPSTSELAEFIITAIGVDSTFKLTAGLHRAVRYIDPQTGFHHHGFLNIAVATALARAGADTHTVVEALASHAAEELVAVFHVLDGSWRESFQSFGTCSVTEPAETLIELGILSPALVAEESARPSLQEAAT